jgi:hypothetical protein
MAFALTQFASDGSSYCDARRSKPSDEVEDNLEVQWHFSADAPHALSFYRRDTHAVSKTILEAHGLNRCIGGGSIMPCFLFSLLVAIRD